MTDSTPPVLGSPDAEPAPITIRLRPGRIAAWMAVVVATVLAGHLAFTVGSAVTGHPLYLLPRVFDMGGEANVPAFLSALNLMVASGVLLVVAAESRREGRGHVRSWRVLAAGFAYLSLDEAAEIHEGFVGALAGRTTGLEAGWHYTWYLVYLPVLIGVAVAYVPFLLKLPRRTAGLVVAAGALFVGGAIGVEIFEAYLIGSGASEVEVLMSRAVEETAEMAGVVLFIYALLDLLRRRRARVLLAASG